MNNNTKRRRPTRWNTETFKERVFELVGDEYAFSGEYVNNRTHMNVIHRKCGNEYKVLPGSFLGGTRCRTCMYKQKSKDYVKTHRQFLIDLKKVHGDEYVPLQKYTGVFDRIDFRHSTCGKTWNTTPSIILNGSTCRHCHGKVFDNETFVSKVKSLVGNEYTFTEPYISAIDKLSVRHKKCGKTFYISPTIFLSGTRCFYCEQKRPKYSEAQFLEAFNDRANGEYVLIGKIQGASRLNEIFHEVCGKTFKMTGSDFLRGRTCTNCKMSRGEEQVSFWLNDNGYIYEKEYIFNDCRKVNPLPFDFAVFNKSGILCLIEYEGEQHFEPVNLFGGREGLRVIQENDQIKRSYCIENNIPLIEIPYWEVGNIGDILSSKINKLATESNIKNEQIALF